MAGQPQDPQFQPAPQDQAQARAAWPRPTFTPPAGSPQETSVFAHQPGQHTQPQPAQQPGQPYPSQSYTPPGQSYADQGYDTQVYPRQGYAAAGQQGQSAPGQPGQPQPQQPQPQQRSGYQGQSSPRQRSTEKGFVGSLFDFSFTSMVTPKIIKFVYRLLAFWTVFTALVFLIISIEERHSWSNAMIFITLFIIDPLYILLSLGIFRVIMEAFVVMFRLYEETKKIREQGEQRG
jgi:hypothetical protein